MKKIVVGIQARLGSTRLHGKVLMSIGRSTIIEHIFKTSYSISGITEVCVLTGSEDKNKLLIDFCRDKAIPIMLGDDDDVLSRYVSLQNKTRADILVRLTGDNPLVQKEIIEVVIDKLLKDGSLDYASNCVYQDAPLGLNVEAFTANALKGIADDTTPEEREHVTPRFKFQKDKFKILHIKAPNELHWPELRLTIDEKQDFDFLNGLYNRLGEKIWNIPFLLKYLRNNSNLIINSSIEQKRVYG